MTESERKAKQHKVRQKDYLGLIAPHTVYDYSDLGHSNSESEREKHKQAKVKQKDYLSLIAPQTVFDYSGIGSPQRQRKTKLKDNLEDIDNTKSIKVNHLDRHAIFNLTAPPPTNIAAAKFGKKCYQSRSPGDKNMDSIPSRTSTPKTNRICNDNNWSDEADKEYIDSNGMARFHSTAEVAEIIKRGYQSAHVQNAGDGSRRIKLKEESAVDYESQYLCHKFGSLKTKHSEFVTESQKGKKSFLRTDKRKYYFSKNETCREKDIPKYSPSDNTEEVRNERFDLVEDLEQTEMKRGFNEQEKEIFICLARKNTKQKNDYIESRKIEMFKELLELDHDEEPLELEEKRFDSLNGSDGLIDIKRIPNGGRTRKQKKYRKEKFASVKESEEIMF